MIDAVEEVNGIKFIRVASGRLAGFSDFLRETERRTTDTQRALRRAIRVADADPDGWDLNHIERLLEDWETWIVDAREGIKNRRREQVKKERIQKLRNTTGRTPEEAAAFLRKADELENS